MSWMHRIQEQHGLVRTERIQQLFVSFDEGLLFFRIELSADDFRLVVFQAQPVQQGDQPRTAFVNHAEFPLDKGSNFARAARQGLGNMSLQRFLLLRGKMARTASSIELFQARDPALAIELAPASDRIVIKIENLSGTSSSARA